MAANAYTRRYTTLNDTDWLEIAAFNKTRQVFMLQVGAASSAVYIHVGPNTPNISDAFLISALDTLELTHGSIVGPVRIKASTGGIASLVLLEG